MGSHIISGITRLRKGLATMQLFAACRIKKDFYGLAPKTGLTGLTATHLKFLEIYPMTAEASAANFIHCLYEDPTGILWAGTENGLYQFNEATESFLQPKGTANIPIRDIRMDEKGNL